MFGKARNLILLSALFTFILLAMPSLQVASKSTSPQKFDYPAPRYAKIPDITTVDQLLPFVRRIVGRPMPYTGDQRPGYGIKGGEKTPVCH